MRTAGLTDHQRALRIFAAFVRLLAFQYQYVFIAGMGVTLLPVSTGGMRSGPEWQLSH